MHLICKVIDEPNYVYIYNLYGDFTIIFIVILFLTLFFVLCTYYNLLSVVYCIVFTHNWEICKK